MKRLLFLPTILAVLLAGMGFTEGQRPSAHAVEKPSGWPGWRGPNGDGVSLETGWNEKALEGGAKILWTAMIGPGYSNVAITDGRLFTMGTRDSQLVFSCLDAASGSVIWEKVFDELGDPAST